jgi:hypothetical protein
MEGAVLVHFTPNGETVKSELLWFVTNEIEDRDQIQTLWKISKGRHLVAWQSPFLYGYSDGRNSK